ncbi:MAG: hypothetical protein MR446_04240 [Bacteroidales bacterium]|nr:hypothetical protein [Bacteroidales bacterium]
MSENFSYVKIFFQGMKNYFQGMTKNFQGMEKFFQGMEIILKILPCAVSVRVLTSEGRIGSARRGCGPYHLRRQRLQGLRADGRDVEEEANVKS